MKKRGDCNITPCLHPKLQRRITYERHESEVDVGRNWGTSHVGNGDVIILKFFSWGARVRRGMRTRIMMTDTGVLGNHPSRVWRRDWTRLR